MFAKSVISVSVMLIASFANAQNAAPSADAGACKPNYEVTFDSCATEAHGYIDTPTHLGDLVANEGATKNLSMGNCNDALKQVLAHYPTAKDVVYSNLQHTDNADAGSFWADGRLQIKQKITCDADFVVPMPVKRVDTDCRILSVDQTATCFKAMTPADVDECLAARPKEMKGYFQKAACLRDANNPTVILDLTKETYAKVQRQLEIFSGWAASAPNNVQMSQLAKFLNKP